MLALDQGTKWLVLHSLTLGETVPVLGSVLQITLVKNPGAAFSFASGSTWIFTLVSSTVVIALAVFAFRVRRPIHAIIVGILLGGAAGNLIDRLTREPGFGVGHVVDFIATPWLLPAIYNVADVAISASMVLFLAVSLRDGRRASSETDAAEPE